MNQRHPSSGFAFFILLLLILLIVAGFLGFKMAAPVPTLPLTPPPGSSTNQFNPTPQLTVEVLAEPRTLWAGFITDALGKPIAGASVSHLGNNPSPASTLSDDNGHFRLILIAGTAPQVSIEAQGYFQVQVLLSSDSSAVYTLFRGGVLEGTVLGHKFYLTTEEPPAPTPIAGAVVEVAASSGWSISVTTDEQGKYRVTTPPGKLVVSARSDNHADVRFDNLEVGRDEVLSRDLILPAGVILDAFIMSKDQPLVDARVRVYNDALDHADERSGVGGKTRLFGLASGFAAVHIVHPGYQEKSFDIIVPNDRLGVRRPFLIKKSESFQVTVTDHRGHTLADAGIRIRKDRRTVTETTASDHAALSVLASGQTYTIEVRPPASNQTTEKKLPPRTFIFKMPAEGPGELKVELRPGGRITGVVRAPNGSAVAGAMVLIQANGLETGQAPPPRLVKTNHAGLFRSQPFAAGSWTVSISHPQVGTMQLETTVQEGKDRSLGALVFPVQ